MSQHYFSYILQHDDTGYKLELFFSLEEIELSSFLERYPRYSIIARRASTRIEDKIGRTIYEGDIVKVYYDDIVRIVFEKGIFLGKGDTHDYLLHKMESDDFEIIGSIYEKSELLIH